MAISSDPIGFNAGDANLYRYVENQVTTYTDPSGLEGEPQPDAKALQELGSRFYGIATFSDDWLNPTGNSSGIVPTFSGMMRKAGRFYTVAGNMRASGHGMGSTIYTASGVFIGDEVGVTNVSDACSRHDAVDAHQQSGLERSFKGTFGGVQLIASGFGLKFVGSRIFVFNRGTATIMQHPGNPTHFSVEVANGSTTLHTHQVVTHNGTRIVTAAESAPGTTTLSNTAKLSNARRALERQQELLKIENLGPYDKVSNSCVSHVADVLEAGGAKPLPPAPSGSSQLKYLLNLLRGKLGKK